MAVALDLNNVGDIPTYSALIDKARLWLDRGADSELDPLFPTFVGNTEAHLNRVLRVPDMETFAPMMAADGAFTLPLDCLQLRSLTAAGRLLVSSSPGDLATRYAAIEGGYATGCAEAYAIIGRQVQVAPKSTEALALTYWQRIPTLSLNQPSNWLLDAHPDIYLYGTLFHANTYIVDPGAAAGWSTLFDAAVSELMESAKRARFGGPIVMRSPVRTVVGARA